MRFPTKFGFAAPAQSQETILVAPLTVGLDARSAAEVTAPGSMLSAQNCWIVNDDLMPRYRVQQNAPGQNLFQDVICGAVNYDDVRGVRYQVAASHATVGYLSGASWIPLTYSGLTPFTGTQTDDIFGVSVYLPRIDENILILVNGKDQAQCWGGPNQSNGTTLSSLTQAPVAADVTLINNRPLFWNVADTSTTTRFVTRAQWTVRGDPEDETNLGSGSEDLVDMRGGGTRCFTLDDQAILATDKEIWTGRAVGDPFIFDFQPLVRTQGIPFKRAALRCPYGVVWLGDDYNVYLLESTHVQPKAIGGKVLAILRDTLADFTTAFFGYNATLRALTLYYTANSANYPQRALTYHLDYDAWTPQVFTQQVVRAGDGAGVSSSATTWGGLVGTLAVQTFTYNQLAGGSSGGLTEALYSSTGTAYNFSASATSDDGQTVLHEALLQLAPAYERYWQLGKVRTMIAADSASTLSIGVSADGGLTVPYEQRFSISANSQATTTPMFCNVLGSTLQVRLRDDTGGFWKVPKVIGHGTIRGPVV